MPRAKRSGSDSRERLLQAAGRGFRVGGYGGIGVDGLAKEAGLTSGAFYAHFGSKAEAFRLALVEGLAVLSKGIARFKGRFGVDWQRPFVEFYLGERMAAGLNEACALPTFTADVARADTQTRALYEELLERLAADIAEGLPGADREARAWQLLALLAGGAAMARAVQSPLVRARILQAVQEAALRA